MTKHYGERLLLKFKGSPSAMLKDYLPQYDWQEWRFARVPFGFWDDPTNRRRYLDWLGTQLGYRHPQDWSRLRAADLRAHHGAGLLKEGTARVAAIVAEYLTHRRKPPRG